MDNLSKIQPYQSIDFLLAGKKINDLKSPLPGFVITFPDKNLSAEYVEENCDIEALKAKSNWPNCVSVRPCWIHKEQVIFGNIQKRKYWSPR